MKPNFKDYFYSFVENISGWIIILSVIHFMFFLCFEIGPELLKKPLRHEKPDYFMEKSRDSEPLCIYKDDTNCLP